MLAFPLVHVNASPSNTAARIVTDGACEPFARGVGVLCGWVVVAASHCGSTSAHSRVEPGPGVTNPLVEWQAVPGALESAIEAGSTGRECCSRSARVINPVLDPWACQACLALRLHPRPRHVARPVHPLDAQMRRTPRTPTAWADQLRRIADRRTVKGGAHG
jgi:ribonuclease HI